MDKKGNIMSVIYIVGGLFLLMIIGMGLVFGSVMMNWIFDTVVPEISGIGQVGSTNVTQISGSTLTKVNSFVQSWTWLTGVLYVFGIFGIIGLSYAVRFTGNKWLMAFFISAMLMVVIASIFMSNIYESFYTGTDDIAVRLQEHTMISWLILYSPLIMTIIGFLCGIIAFSGEMEEKV